jgi:hypothetical protein
MWTATSTPAPRQQGAPGASGATCRPGRADRGPAGPLGGRPCRLGALGPSGSGGAPCWPVASRRRGRSGERVPPAAPRPARRPAPLLHFHSHKPRPSRCLVIANRIDVPSMLFYAHLCSIDVVAERRGGRGAGGEARGAGRPGGSRAGGRGRPARARHVPPSAVVIAAAKRCAATPASLRCEYLILTDREASFLGRGRAAAARIRPKGAAQWTATI